MPIDWKPLKRSQTPAPLAAMTFAQATPVRIEGDTGPFRVELLPKILESGVEEITAVLTADEAHVPPPITLAWNEPLIDTSAVWTTDSDRPQAVGPDWRPSMVQSKATSQAPVICAISPSGRNRACIALSDALHGAQLSTGVTEETGKATNEVVAFAGAPSASDRFEVKLRIDRRDIPYERALESVASWWATQPGYRPAKVPEAARLPMYSTWYSMHQRLEPDELVEQCRLAKTLGCEAVIVDDGWQTKDSNRLYGFTGDWDPERIPEMKELVDRVHAEGMKFMLWYSVPFVGVHSRAYERFSEKLLSMRPDLEAGILDPRDPEVREYLIQTYERAVREWGLDGLKLDFVDYFTRDADPSAEEAVDLLLTECMERLRAINPEIMIEFRQTYVGPKMRVYGNMFRANDCPGDHERNHQEIVAIRLLCGDTACHSDMLMWHPSEPVESAALQLLEVLFSVPQISVMLDRIPESHSKMLEFWLGFWREHRSALLDGEFEAKDPRHGYTIVSGRTDEELVAGIYAPDKALTLGESTPDRVHLVNATSSDRALVIAEKDLGRCRVEIHDTMGNRISEVKMNLPKSARPYCFDVPPSGLVTITKID
jgi:alpha-galactosidase